MALLSEESPLNALMNNFVQAGEVVYIGVRPASRQPVIGVEQTMARIGTGLDGDRYKGNADSKRQVTLIQAEHLQAIASFLGKSEIDPALVRRNIVVKGINLLALKEKRFKIGEAILEMTGLCHPCSRMENILGEGGYNAMLGHGGITCKVIEEGNIKLGDIIVA
ncbi:MOSC domain-containing protein [Arcicella aquatica]|uniref:MOSC domain-containing protein n=1 Tax=Arcicella aquatica TaxID=217141 RepID=A0ABU5QN90_9BACT|nr:MOSC domain-containing protein [Arcicella aquatica]MEA5258537.1 MOSC domain-containing protein [Arcicella aquatica]